PLRPSLEIHVRLRKRTLQALRHLPKRTTQVVVTFDGKRYGALRWVVGNGHGLALGTDRPPLSELLQDCFFEGHQFLPRYESNARFHRMTIVSACRPRWSEGAPAGSR